MEKDFLEIFSRIDDDSLNPILKSAKIIRISTNKTKDKMRIYLRFNSVVPKQSIWKMEKAIKQEYFQHENMQINIIESFQLSDVYTSESLFDMYKDSIFEEVQKISGVTYSIIKKADFDFLSGTIVITLEDTAIAHTREEEIFHIFSVIFHDRCNLDVKIEIKFKDAMGSKYIKAQEEKIERAIDNIIERVNSIASEDGVTEEAPPKKSASTEKKAEDKGKNAPAAEEIVEEKPLYKPFRKENIPNLLFGFKPISDEPTPIEDVFDGIGEVVLRGQITFIESREVRNNKTIISFNISDFTDTLSCKIFIPTPQAPELEGLLAKGSFIKVFGTVSFDDYSKDICCSRIRSIESIPDFREKRHDLASEKRVELHCHTKMSDSDGVSDIEDILAQAINFGHKA
nr:hypothetical protein [Lachnospiraceae bacterium]